MTKKDYELLASTVKALPFEFDSMCLEDKATYRELVTERLSVALAADNPRFSVSKFSRACLEGY